MYSMKNKFKPEYIGLPGEEIKNLKMSGVQIPDTIRVAEVAFIGDTTSDFILDDANIDALQAKLLIMEVLKCADRLRNKSILFIQFSPVGFPTHKSVASLRHHTTSLPSPLVPKSPLPHTVGQLRPLPSKVGPRSSTPMHLSKRHRDCAAAKTAVVRSSLTFPAPREVPKFLL